MKPIIVFVFCAAFLFAGCGMFEAFYKDDDIDVKVKGTEECIEGSVDGKSGGICLPDKEQ